MHVDDVREEVERRDHLHDGAAEVHRAGVVIPEPEHAVAVVERRAVDEVNGQLAQARLEDGRGQDLRAEGHLDVRGDRPQPVTVDVDLPVAWQHDADIVTETPQLLGERGRDVGYPAELGERRQLGGRDQHLQVLGLGDLDSLGLPRHPDAKRARRRHDLDVLALAADDESNLERITSVLRYLAKRYGDEERILDGPGGVHRAPRVWFEHVRDADRAALSAGRDANDVRGVETEIDHGGTRQRKVDVSIAVRRRRTCDVEPELRVLLLELIRGARRVDPEIEAFVVAAIKHSLDHAGRPVQRAESRTDQEVAGLTPRGVIA